MQTQFSLSKNKFFWIILALVVLLGIPETRHALADYLGPNRKVITHETETIDVGVWAKDDPTGNSCNHTHGTDCIVCTWEGSPGKPCGDAEYSYKTGTETRTIDVVSYLPEATINGTLQNCNLSNGWCTNATTLLLTSTEPVAGYSIILVEGTRNGETFTCPDPNNCVVDLVAGDNTFTYWALSDYGDSSQMGTLTAKVDAVKPEIIPTIDGTMGKNGWFVTDVTATFSASDPAPGSCLNTFETSLDNVSWAPYVSPLVFTEGTYHLYVQATDFAANVHSLDDEIKVDTNAPTIIGTISGTLGSANWYVTAPQASVTATDSTSGIAVVEYNVDNNGWQPYSTAVTFDDGPHTIQFRTYDVAGWSAETEMFSFQVDTTGPSIKLPSRWYIWESADFIVKDDQSKVVGVSYEIRDGQNRWKKVERGWTPNTHEFSRTISWNRIFADGITAPIGSYRVRVYAEDAAGNVSWKDAEIVIPGVDDPPLPTFTPTPTVEPTEEVVAPPADATATPTPIPPVSEEDDDDEEAAPFVFGGNTPDDSPDTEPEAPAPSSSVLWGAAAAAAIGTYNATMAEKKRREEEAARRKRNSESAQRRRAEKEGRLDEYIREKRKAKEASIRAEAERILQKDNKKRAAKQREQSGLTGKEWKAKEAQQAIWDANGRAIYDANQQFKKDFGKEMDAEIREKAIAAATIEGVFNIDEYKGMLNATEQIMQQMSGAGSGQGALYSPVPQSGNGDDLDSATRHYIAMAEAIMADPSLYERMTGKPIPPHLYGQLGISVPSPTSTPLSNGKNIVDAVYRLIENGTLPAEVASKLQLGNDFQSNCAIFLNTILREANVGVFDINDERFLKVPDTHLAYGARNGEYRYTVRSDVDINNLTQEQILQDLMRMGAPLEDGAMITTISAETYPGTAYAPNIQATFGHGVIHIGDGEVAEMSGPSFWAQNENGQYTGWQPDSNSYPFYYYWNAGSADPITTRPFWDTSRIPAETLVSGNPTGNFPNDYIIPRMTTTISIIPPDPITPERLINTIDNGSTELTDLEKKSLSEFVDEWKVIDNETVYETVEYKKDDCYIGATGDILQQEICLPSTPYSTTP